MKICSGPGNFRPQGTVLLWQGAVLSRKNGRRLRRRSKSSCLEEDSFLENRIDACRLLAACRRNLGDMKGAYEALFASFCYDTPRAETCCDLGAMFLNANLWSSPFTGTSGRWKPGRKSGQAGSSRKTVTAICPVSGCACATTGWETTEKPFPITKRRPRISRKTATCPEPKILPGEMGDVKAIGNFSCRCRGSVLE